MSLDDQQSRTRERQGRLRAALVVQRRSLKSPRFSVRILGAYIKLAGSLSLAVSLPTMLVGFARYSQDSSFAVLEENRGFVLVTAAGSIAGSFIGGQLLGLLPTPILLPMLALILVLAAFSLISQNPSIISAKSLFQIS